MESENGDSERVRRQEPGRTGPNRAFTGIFGATPNESAQLISASVDAAYRVVDAYFDYGRRYAEAVSPSSSPDGVYPPQQGPQPSRPAQAGDDAFKVYAESMARLMTAGMKMFAEFLIQQTPVQQAPAKDPPTPAAATAPPAAPGESAMARISITASPGERVITASTKLPNAGSLAGVSIVRLGSEGESFPTLELSGSDTASVRFVVNVRPDQAPGRYNWMLADPAGLPLAVLSLTISPDGAPHD